MTCFTVASQLTPAQSEALAKAQDADAEAVKAKVNFDLAERAVSTWFETYSDIQPFDEAFADVEAGYFDATEFSELARRSRHAAEFNRDRAALAFVRAFQRES